MDTAVRQADKMFSVIDWTSVSTDMHDNGYARIPGVLSDAQCDEFIRNYDTARYRKTVTMERHRFGLGEYKYFDYPLPDLVQTAREEIFPRLAPVANEWAERLNLDVRYPASFAAFQAECHKAGQLKPTPLI